jgi:hypothetical protein
LFASDIKNPLKESLFKQTIASIKTITGLKKFLLKIDTRKNKIISCRQLTKSLIIFGKFRVSLNAITVLMLCKFGLKGGGVILFRTFLKNE